MDPGLRFWMSYVDARGGLTERSGDSTLVVLPPAVAGEFDLPDEFMVTDEPDVAREDGAVLLATGHPVLIQAADSALSHGDVGVVTLAPPTTPAPDSPQLEQRVRDQVQVEHGKIDVTGLPTRVDRPVLRLGALVTYSLSADEHYQERLECWIDAGSGRQLAPDVVARLRAAPRAERATPARPPVLEAVSAAVGRAHAILDAAAERRRTALSGQASDAHRRERAHARDYYADVLRSLERRRASADPDRAELLSARAASTREERSRRLLEIDEKYQARHEIRPFRLHAVLVPGWRVPVDVRRGPRRYPFAFDWLAALGAFAEERCPHCGAAATLSASKNRLGCIDCLPGAGAVAATA
ncbi:hypothetical protein [Pseudonocardia nigra]|uniref:hypothetical protein n=1 Tax=Pseudonocardia nigra TaxID=1921578 RepID=UPI001C5F25FC|nr:hypothetical protein [Pseudonocardia nigra]